MSMLETVNNNNYSEGVRFIIAGVEKMGKTTLAIGSPNPLLVPLEIGYGGVTVPKTKMIESYDEVIQLLDEIIESCEDGIKPCETLIFDSATALERRLHEHVVQLDENYSEGNPKSVTMQSALGGYGKAYSRVNQLFDIFLKKCDHLAVYFGINIILTCHVFTSKFVDPQNGEYNCWDLLLHCPNDPKTYGKRQLVTQWADIIGFIYDPFHVSKKEDHKTAVNAKRGRVLTLSNSQIYPGGNRFGVEGEIALPKEFGWNYLAQAVNESSPHIDIFTRYED